MTSLIKFPLQYNNFISFTICKRFAGHSKWANIRHTKMAKDAQKSDALRIFTNKIRIAITEGKSAKPEDNPKLARVIEEAKKKSMPMATIKNFLEKVQSSKVGNQSAFFESKGPSGSLVLIHLLTSNIALSRNNVNHHLKKSRFAPSEPASQHSFCQKGLIYAEVGNCDLDKATDDAIEVGAEDAEKLEEDGKEFLQFTCGSGEVNNVRKKLEDLNYKIIEADVLYIPLKCVVLSDDEMEFVSKLYNRLSEMEEVVNLYNNIAI